MKVEGDKVRVSFAHTGGGLKSRDGKPLTAFEIAGEDGKFVPAEATIDGKDVVVSAKDVATPTQVRFGWTNTANPNLCEQGGAARRAVPHQGLEGRHGRVNPEETQNAECRSQNQEGRKQTIRPPSFLYSF